MNFFPSSCSYGNIECSFDNPAKNFSKDGLKLSAQGLKMIRKPNFCKRNNLPQKVSMDTKIAIMTYTLENFDTRPDFFRPLSETMRKKVLSL